MATRSPRPTAGMTILLIQPCLAQEHGRAVGQRGVALYIGLHYPVLVADIEPNPRRRIDELLRNIGVDGFALIRIGRLAPLCQQSVNLGRVKLETVWRLPVLCQ